MEFQAANLLTVKQEGYAGLPGWAQCNHKGGRVRQKRENQRDGSMRWTWRDIVGFEDGASSHEPRKAAGF